MTELVVCCFLLPFALWRVIVRIIVKSNAKQLLVVKLWLKTDVYCFSNFHHYLCQGGNVFARLCLSVCLSVC